MKTMFKKFLSLSLSLCICFLMFSSDIVVETQAAGTGLTLTQLRQKFPHGKYWNGGNADSYTSSPCTHHYNCNYNGSCGCNSFKGLSIQCMGYAEKLGYDATGYNPRNNANGWYTNYSSSAIDSLKPGDIVRYLNNGHSIYVTAVNGNTVTYTDCNHGNTCKIRWDATISKSELKSSFTYVRQSPASAAPTVANLSINKTSLKIGEQFTLSLSADSYCMFYLSIIDADSGEVIVGSGVSNTYTNAFQRAGHYTAWMSAYNANGSVDSNAVDFYVYGSPPSEVSFSANKTELTVGEAITFSTSTDAYYVRIYASVFFYNESNNGTNVLQGDISYNYDFFPTEDGIYTGYVTVSTHEGVLDSDWITFYVGKYNVKYDANGGNGAPSNQTKTYGETITLSTTVPSRTGYIFCGWSSDQTATVATYQPGDNFTLNEDTMLYAVWKSECVSNGHSYTYNVTTAPTKSTTGVLSGKCSKCLETTTVALPELNTTNYTYAVKKAANCTEVGIGRYTWKNTVYGSFYFDENIAATGHSTKSVAAKAPTCSSVGWNTYETCTKCDYTTYKEIAKDSTAHKWDSGKITATATCNKSGVKTYICQHNASHKKTENLSINPSNHANTKNVAEVKATCTTKGYTSGVYCNDCQKYISGHKEIAIDTNAHSWDNGTITTTATCEVSGVKTYICQHNASHKKTENLGVNVSNHVNTKNVAEVKASCSSVGYTAGVYCNDCQKYISGHKEISVLGHLYKNTVTAPTCTSEGYTTHTCSRCQNTYTDTKVNATGHKWGEWKEVSAPTFTANGKEERSCSFCKKTESRTTDKLNYRVGDVDKNGSITAADARLALRASVGLENLSDSQKKAADADGNGTITAADARLILRASVGLEKLDAFIKD